MREKIFLTLLFIYSLGCKKEYSNTPLIDLKIDTSGLISYITENIPLPQHKAILIEDIRGVQCNNCPKAVTKANEIITQKTEDSVVLIGVYTTHLPNFTTPYSGFPVLTSMYSFQIVDALGAPTGLPSGYVDRAIISPQTVRFNAYTTFFSAECPRYSLPSLCLSCDGCKPRKRTRRPTYH